MASIPRPHDRRGVVVPLQCPLLLLLLLALLLLLLPLLLLLLDHVEVAAGTVSSHRARFAHDQGGVFRGAVRKARQGIDIDGRVHGGERCWC